MPTSQYQNFRSVRRSVIFALAVLVTLATVSPALASSKGRGHHHRGNHGHHRSYGHISIAPYFYGPYIGLGYGYYGPYGHYGYYPGYGGYGYYRAERLGGLKLKVKPKDTQVWVNGGLVGQTDNFDGYPGNLWLPEDSYEVILYREGYETVVRNYRLLPGVVVKEKFEMTPGTAVDPKELTTFPEPKALEDKEETEPVRYYRPRKRPARKQADVAPGESVYDARQVPGRARLEVQPADASVYLDGEFLGRASNLPGDAAMELAAGEHVIEAVRPGLRSVEKRFTVKSGETIDVVVRLGKPIRGEV